jgi:hypothetical protein
MSLLGGWRWLIYSSFGRDMYLGLALIVSGLSSFGMWFMTDWCIRYTTESQSSHKDDLQQHLVSLSMLIFFTMARSIATPWHILSDCWQLWYIHIAKLLYLRIYCLVDARKTRTLLWQRKRNYICRQVMLIL